MDSYADEDRLTKRPTQLTESKLEVKNWIGKIKLSKLGNKLVSEVWLVISPYVLS